MVRLPTLDQGRRHVPRFSPLSVYQWFSDFTTLGDCSRPFHHRASTATDGGVPRRHLSGRRSPSEDSRTPRNCRHGHGVDSRATGPAFHSYRSAVCRRTWQAVAASRCVLQFSQSARKRCFRVCSRRCTGDGTFVLGVSGSRTGLARSLEPCVPWTALPLGRSGRCFGGRCQCLADIPLVLAEPGVAIGRRGPCLIAHRTTIAKNKAWHPLYGCAKY